MTEIPMEDNTKVKNTWKRERFLDVGDIWSDSDVWSCPDCEWAVTLESYEDFDADAPVEHEYKYCPHCGKKRLFHSEADKKSEGKHDA